MLAGEVAAGIETNGHGWVLQGWPVLPRAQLVLTLPPPPENPDLEPLALVNLPRFLNMTLDD